MNSIELRRRITRSVPTRVIVGIGGIALAVAFVTGPTVLGWWIGLFI